MIPLAAFHFLCAQTLGTDRMGQSPGSKVRGFTLHGMMWWDG